MGLHKPWRNVNNNKKFLTNTAFKRPKFTFELASDEQSDPKPD